MKCSNCLARINRFTASSFNEYKHMKMFLSRVHLMYNGGHTWLLFIYLIFLIIYIFFWMFCWLLSIQFCLFLIILKSSFEHIIIYKLLIHHWYNVKIQLLFICKKTVHSLLLYNCISIIFTFLCFSMQFKAIFCYIVQKCYFCFVALQWCRSVLCSPRDVSVM